MSYKQTGIFAQNSDLNRLIQTRGGKYDICGQRLKTFHLCPSSGKEETLLSPMENHFIDHFNNNKNKKDSEYRAQERVSKDTMMSNITIKMCN